MEEAGRTRGAGVRCLVVERHAHACVRNPFGVTCRGTQEDKWEEEGARASAREKVGGLGGGNLISRDRGGAARGVSVEETEVKLGAQRRWRRRWRQRQRGGAGYCPRPL